MEFGGMRCLDDFGLNPSCTHCVFYVSCYNVLFGLHVGPFW